jgi:hypothetical protein
MVGHLKAILGPAFGVADRAKSCEVPLSECGFSALAEPSTAFQKPFTAFWNGVQTRDAAWQAQSLDQSQYRKGRAKI